MFQRYKDYQYNLSSLQIQIMDLLKFKSRYGYEILKDLEHFHLNTATLYPALKKLEDLGFIKWYSSTQERGPKKRKNYELTEKGFEFVQNRYALKDLPLHYVEGLRPEIEAIKLLATNLETLVIDSTNFFNFKELLKTKYFFSHDIPPNIRFVRYYDFLKEEFVDIFDGILIAFPFFIKDTGNTKANLIQFFRKVRNQLRPGRRLFIADLFGDIEAVSDLFSYFMYSEVKNLLYSFEEMKQILREASWTNFDLMKKFKGVILFNTS